MISKEAQSALDDINKIYKDNHLILRLSDNTGLDIKRTTCNRLSIDSVFGGGTPDGRIIELFGQESSGKTTIALHILAAYQEKHKEKATALIDFEHAFDKTYAKNLGVDVEDLVISQPSFAEQGLTAVEKLINSAAYSCIIVDSIAAMVPKSELEGEVGAASVAVQARLMSQIMRKITGAANKTKTTVVFINQMREKVGVMFGSPWVTAGGNALKFYASIRAEIVKGSKQKDKDGVVLANRGKIKVVKNKTYPPYKECEFDIEFGVGISREADVLDFGVAFDIIKKSGSWYSLEDTKLGQGREAVKDLLKDNPDLCDEVENRILEYLTSNEEL